MAPVPKLLILPEEVLEISLKESFRGHSIAVRDRDRWKYPSDQTELLPLSMSIFLTCRRLDRASIPILFLNITFHPHDNHNLWSVIINESTVRKCSAGSFSKARHVSGHQASISPILLVLDNDCSSYEDLESVLIRNCDGRTGMPLLVSKFYPPSG